MKNGLNVSIICLFNTNNFDRTPYKNNRHIITNNHCIVCNARGEVFHTNSSFQMKKKSEGRNYK
jgi:hypothetical protein